MPTHDFIDRRRAVTGEEPQSLRLLGQLAELLRVHSVAEDLAAAVLADKPGGAAARSSEGDVWLARVQSLDEDAINSLLPLVEGNDALDTLRKLIGLCQRLANPALAMDALRKPRDECIKEIFELRTVAAVLEQGGDASSITLDAWCRHYLEELAAGDTDFAERFARWCGTMIARFDPMLSAVVRRFIDSAEDARCIPVLLPSEDTQRLRTPGGSSNGAASDDEDDAPPDGSASTH
jgi:hypothetical protein